MLLYLLTSVGAPGLWQLLTSPFLSSFSPRRNSLLRSVPRRISFSRGGVMSMGGVVLDGGCETEQKETKSEISSGYNVLYLAIYKWHQKHGLNAVLFSQWTHVHTADLTSFGVPWDGALTGVRGLVTDTGLVKAESRPEKCKPTLVSLPLGFQGPVWRPQKRRN